MLWLPALKCWAIFVLSASRTAFAPGTTMRILQILLLTILVIQPNFASLSKQQISKSIYHDAWIDLNKNGRMDIYENQKAPIDQRVEDLLAQMTLEEKIDLLGGVDGFFIRGVPRLNFPRLKMADGPIGVRNFGPATAMAGGIALAATWNPALAERVGTEIGSDARAKGVHFLLGPGVNIYRAPMNGRNFEYFGEDPFLASRIAVGYIKGVQSQGVSATIKHFMGNNSEFDRHNTDSIIDERTMREIYLPVFEAAVKEAHVGAIMDSYNLTNGAHLTQNGYLNTDVAKKEWGFGGIMMSDWTATYDAVAAANGGLDLEMPSAKFMNRQNLLPAIKDGKVSVATIDEKVKRILRTAIRFGWLDRDQTDISIPRYNQQGRLAALQGARESMVLLKNEGNLLPLDNAKSKSIAVIGPDAYPRCRLEEAVRACSHLPRSVFWKDQQLPGQGSSDLLPARPANLD